MALNLTDLAQKYLKLITPQIKLGEQAISQIPRDIAYSMHGMANTGNAFGNSTQNLLGKTVPAFRPITNANVKMTQNAPTLKPKNNQDKALIKGGEFAPATAVGLATGNPLLGVKTALPFGMLGGAMNKASGGSFKEGFIQSAEEGYKAAPALSMIAGLTNPLISSGIKKASGGNAVKDFMLKRIAAGVGNVAQGVPISESLGQSPTLGGAAIDFGVGAVFPGQFNGNKSALRDYNFKDKPTAILKQDAGVLDQAMEILQGGIKSVDKDTNALRNNAAKSSINHLADIYLSKEEIDKAVAKTGNKTRDSYFRELGRILQSKGRDVTPDYADVKAMGMGLVGEKSLFGYEPIKTGSYSSEATPETVRKILKKDAESVARESQFKIEEAANKIAKSIEENTTGAVQKEAKQALPLIGNSAKWKDKATLNFSRETMDRNFEDVMGKDSTRMKEIFLDPIKKSEADRIRWLNKERADIQSLGIDARDKESALLQDFGENKLNLEQLKERTPEWEKVVNAEKVFRQKYDSYLKQINDVLVKNDYDPIPKRKDYFTHFQEIQSALERFGIPVGENKLPTDINGLTADFKPGKNFFASALPRLGEKTTVNAVAGIDRYLEGASKEIFHTDDIQRLRALEKTIREAYAGTDHLSNFAKAITEYTNTLAGKKAMIDRALESVIGRNVYGVMGRLKKQVGANAVGANVSSALTNFIPLTQSLATTDKPSFIKGMIETISSVFKNDGFVDKSDFLTRRVGSDRLNMGTWDRMGKNMGWLFKTIDGFTSQIITRSKYIEGLGKGMDESSALKYADDWAAKIMADRSLGQTPALFNSQTLGFLTQFQLEVNNQLSFMFKDIPRNYDKKGAASALAQVFLYGYVFNNIFEQLTGRRPAFDPVGVAVQAQQDYTDPNMKEGQVTKNLIKNSSSQLPFTDIVVGGGRIPITGSLPDVSGLISGSTTIPKEIKKVAFGLLPPYGGQQARKSLEGMDAYNKGGSFTDAGKLRFPIPQTPANAVRTSIFGQYSTPEARKYFRQGDMSLSGKQTQKFIEAPNKQDYYNTVQETRDATRNEKKNVAVPMMKRANAAESYIDLSKLPQGRIEDNKIVYIDPETGKDKSINLAIDLRPPTKTGQVNLDEVNTSKWKGRVNQAVNTVQKLYELGVIPDATKAEELIAKLKTLTFSYTKKKKFVAKKPKVTKIKVLKPKVVKLKQYSLKNYKMKKVSLKK